MAGVPCGGPRTLTLITCLALCANVALCLVTEEEMLLMSGDQSAPHCYSRNFMVMICYWEAEELEVGENVTFGCYYSYGEEPEVEFDVTLQSGRRKLYVCEHDEIRMFSDLHILIRNKISNEILWRRTIQVEEFGIIQHPDNIRVSWDDAGDQIHVTWEPPKMDFSFVFQYEVQYWSEDLTHHHQKVLLDREFVPQLKSDSRYLLRIRTSWVGGEKTIWGPWSEVIMFDSPGSADISGLKCFTWDLSHVCCQWKEDNETNPRSSQRAFYRYSEESWQSCREAIIVPHCNCAFLARNDSAASLKINASSADGKSRSYYPKSFWVNKVVLPPAPQLQVQQLIGNKLALNWSSPLPVLSNLLMYQIRFSIDGEKTWKTLEIPAGVQNETLMVVPGATYILQLRAAHSNRRNQHYWSAWSPRVTAKIPYTIDWMILVISLCLLIIPGAMLCVYWRFPSLYRKLKDKLWPPLPNLHRVLDTFLTEIQKQYQPSSTVYEKTLEDAPQPSRLEILSEITLSSEGHPSSRDYVQLSSSNYQNDDYWPKLELSELPLNLISPTQLPGGVINQTYLPTSGAYSQEAPHMRGEALRL